MMVMQRAGRDKRALASDGAHRTAEESGGENLEPLMRLAVYLQKPRRNCARAFIGNELPHHRCGPALLGELRNNSSIPLSVGETTHQRRMVPADAFADAGR